ncbi:MAG: hypothetical protein HXO44_00560 [Prevotella sp.]|nr:hypothetical protein [Prevotella sp.]
MKKNYEKPCCSSMVVAVEQAMLTGSDKGLRITNQNFERADPIVLGPSTAGGAKKNPFDYDEE